MGVTYHCTCALLSPWRLYQLVDSNRRHGWLTLVFRCLTPAVRLESDSDNRWAWTDSRVCLRLLYVVLRIL